MEQALSSRTIDETGGRYNKLVVVNHAGIDKWGQATWECLCDCGNITTIVGSKLRTGKIKSCGCLRHKPPANTLAPGEASFNKIYRLYKANAKNRELSWELSKNEFRVVIKQDCYYCGVAPSNIANHQSLNGSYTYNGIDRLDNSRGYVSGNIVPCCKLCNYMKRDLSENNFYSHIRKIYGRIGNGAST